jgi:hypothetical protein
MKSFCYDLNLNIPLFKSEINPFNFPKVRHTKLPIDSLNPLIVDWFRSLSLEIVLVEVFYSKPNLISGIHTDSTANDINKINWIFGGSNCEMKWYSLKQSNLSKPTNLTPINTRYQLYWFNEVNLEHSQVLHSPSLVNVGVPHNVYNKEEDRWCVSVVYQFIGSKKRPTLHQALTIFKDYINEI